MDEAQINWKWELFKQVQIKIGIAFEEYLIQYMQF